MASYNGDFNRMQEEALARLREMQSRSRTAVNRPKEAQSAPPPPQRQTGAQRPQPQPRPQQPAQRQDIFKSLFGDVKIDSEKALILLMLFVLYRNNADIKLLLALGYLLV